MSRSKVLIVTSKEDSHADYVIQRCIQFGTSDSIIRVNTEDFLHNCIVNFNGTDFTLDVIDSGRSVSGGDILSVWYRRPKDIVTAEKDAGVDAFVKQQATAALRGLYFCCHDTALWVNPLPALHRARIKMQQIALARTLGFRTPATLVTNDPEAAREFSSRVADLCVKSLDEPYFYQGGKLKSVLTTEVPLSRLLGDSDAISRCPVLFQELIPKRVDLRIIVLQGELFAFEIDSQDDELAKIDVRGRAPHLLRHQVHELPLAVANSVREFVRVQGLIFSAMDFVIDAAGNYIFIENNPNGQWLWLELMTKVPISSALLRILFQGLEG